MILIWIIALGLLNFLVFTVVYGIIGGDAVNGKIEGQDYFLRGHFLRHGTSGQATPVSAVVWIYSYVHSITIWPTIGAVLCAMLLLARPHIIATMQEDSLTRGQYFVAAAMTVIVILTVTSMLYFMVSFFQALDVIRNGGTYGT